MTAAPTLNVDIVVLHHTGDPGGGAPWGEVLVRAGWAGQVVAPDLPGHGSTPPPVGGNYELADAAVFGAGLMERLKDESRDHSPVVVGVGTGGWAAQLLALGGRVGALALVDGLGGPWLLPHEAIARSGELLRTLAADPDAMALPPAGGFDPRLRHGIIGQTDRALALRAAAAIDVPVLVVETPESVLDREDAREVARAFLRAGFVEATTRDEAAAAIVSWAGGGAG